MKERREKKPAHPRPVEEPARRPGIYGAPIFVVTAAAAGAVLAYAFASACVPPWSHLGLASQLPIADRRTFAWTVLSGLVLGAAAGFGMLRLPAALRVRLVHWLRCSLLVAFVPSLLDHTLWAAYPLVAPLAALAAAVCWLRWWPFRAEPREASTPAASERAPRIALAAAIALYVALVATAAVRQHRMLETRAYDLGIMENVLWNTCHGRWFDSALEGGNHLGVHTSFILALLAPAYCAVPRPETLLVAQTLLLALAAWPLFLLARDRLESAWQALSIALAYLVHPAVAGANLYDFHELAFLPVLFFAALRFVDRGRLRLAWVALATLLCVKEDMAILVAALGVVWMLDGRRRFGAAVAAAGVFAYAFLQHGVIPQFAGGAHSYTWYFGDMVAHGEGPSGVLVTLLMSPVQAVGYMVTESKLAYAVKLLAPFALLPLAAGSAVVLLGYGLLTAFTANREPLFELGFQYALLVVAPACYATLVALRRLVPGDGAAARRRRARLVAAVLGLSALGWYHDGFGPPGNGFRSGFRQPRLTFTTADAERDAEIRELAALIPAEASVTASETLVPRVARRRRLQTLRYAADAFGRDYEVFFLLRAEIEEARTRFPEVFDAARYELVREGATASIYRRRD